MKRSQIKKRMHGLIDHLVSLYEVVDEPITPDVAITDALDMAVEELFVIGSLAGCPACTIPTDSIPETA